VIDYLLVKVFHWSVVPLGCSILRTVEHTSGLVGSYTVDILCVIQAGSLAYLHTHVSTWRHIGIQAWGDCYRYK